MSLSLFSILFYPTVPLCVDIVRAGNRIAKCFEDRFDDVTVDDLLREMFANPDSENSCIYSEQEQDEFMFRIFRHVAIGGGICQVIIPFSLYFQSITFMMMLTTILLPPSGLPSCRYNITQPDDTTDAYLEATKTM